MLGLFCLGMAARVLVEGRTIPRSVAHGVLAGGAGLVYVAARHDLGTLPAGIGFAAVIVACSTPHAPRVLASRPLAYLGTLSYGIYLWHYPILLALQARDLLPGGFAATCAVVGASSIALAALTWHGFEQPILRAVRVSSRRGGRSAGARPSPRAVPSSG